MLFNLAANQFRRFRKCERGSVIIEFSFIVSLLSVFVVGVVNSGLAFVEQMNVSNAVRSGSQLALVRHPSLDPNAVNDPAVVSLQDIRDAIVLSASFLSSDPGAPDLQVCVFYQCPGGTPTPCLTTAGTPPACLERQTFLTVDLNHAYNFFIPFPGFSQGINLASTHTVRLA